MDIKKQLNHIGIKQKTFAEILGVSRQTKANIFLKKCLFQNVIGGKY